MTHARLAAWTAAATGLFGLLVILLHAGLLGSGEWLADDYFNFALLHQLGGFFLAHRILHWSPRPFSELGLYFYARLIFWLHRPLTLGFLATCWAMSLAATLAGWWRRGDGFSGLCVPLALFALFLLGHPVDEMFYWPMGAGPYQGCLAGIAFACLRLLRSPARLGLRDRVAVAVALVWAAGCAEIGIIFAICLVPPLLLLDVAGRHRSPWKLAGRVALWAVPALFAAGLLLLVLRGRVAEIYDPGGAAAAVYHHAGLSIRAALVRLPVELAGTGVAADAAELLLFAGLVLQLQAAPAPPRRRLVAVALALFGTLYLSLLAGYYQFGWLCCERHESVRQCLVLLLIATLAALAGGIRPGRPVWASPLLLAAAIAVLLPGRVTALMHDYAAQPSVLAARRVSWSTGWGAGRAMVFRLGPQGQLVGHSAFPDPGSYHTGPQTPWYIAGIMMFFGKSQLTVLPAVPASPRPAP